jgi:hypothetical protein
MRVPPVIMAARRASTAAEAVVNFDG